MELIRPTEITGKISSLIKDSSELLIIVSPYNSFVYKASTGWDKILKEFKSAQYRGVKIDYYARKDENQQDLDLINIVPTLIENLHAKIYINDSYAILSSMNLTKYSDENSIDFAVKTETLKEYHDVLDYFNRYIKPHDINKPKKQTTQINTSEVPLTEFFNSRGGYSDIQLDLVKTYHQDTGFIRELGFKKDNQNFGDWFYFSEEGLLTKREDYNSEYQSREVIYKGKTTRYDLIFTVANIVSGIYTCPIQSLYFQSTINEFTNGDNEPLYQYLENSLGIILQKRDCITFESLVENIYNQLLKKPTFIVNNN